MPFLFIVSGLVLVISAARGTNDQILDLLKADVTGPNNFIYWMAAILVIGAVGYIKDIAPVSRAFLVLVVIVLLLKSGGVFQQFTSALSGTQQAQSNTPNTATTGAVSPLTNTVGTLSTLIQA
jgi:hypothetical protein